MKSRQRSYLKLLIALCAFLLIGAGLFFGMQAVERYFVDRADSQALSGLTPDKFGRVEYEGKTYEQKVRLTTTLIIGLDRTEEDAAAMSDFIALYVFDEVEEKSTVIQINRDTMAAVPVISYSGKKSGTAYQQIAYAFSYGDGKNESCRNVQDAVSDLLYDIPVHNYIAVEMGAVEVLNDLVGGVEVEISDDFSALDKTLVKGETVKLMGHQALTYVRARKDVGDQSNLSRMRRQRQYMSAFVDAFGEKVEKDETFAAKAVSETEEYVLTDCTLAELGELAVCVSEYPIEKITVPEGESKKGAQYMEHTLDEDALMKLVIDTFYKEKE